MKKVYTITSELTEDGKTMVTRKNDGFRTDELLGMLVFAQFEIYETIKGRITPDIVKREVVEDVKEVKV